MRGAFGNGRGRLHRAGRKQVIELRPPQIAARISRRADSRVCAAAQLAYTHKMKWLMRHMQGLWWPLFIMLAYFLLGLWGGLR
jgi:hypothetical protein